METVCAVVVTFNRRSVVRKCLGSLRKQRRRPDYVVVVDNGSNDGTPEMVREEFPEAELVRLEVNQGGAGGFAVGMRRAYSLGCSWIWVMDDDAEPSQDCLLHLLEHSEEADVVVPEQVDSEGWRYGLGLWRGRVVEARLQGSGDVLRVDVFTFVGPLISRRVIEEVGLPRGDLFIASDDWEYSLRVRRAGFKVVGVLGAVVCHPVGARIRKVRRFCLESRRFPSPAWKHYYSARNSWLMLSNLSGWERWSAVVWYFVNQVRSTVGDIIYERDWARRVYYRWLGVVHGVVGVAGRRVEPGV